MVTQNSKFRDLLIKRVRTIPFIFYQLSLIFPYITVPPKESAYSFFNPDAGNLHILILFGNPHPIEADRAINYNTTAPGMRADRISKSAKVGLFPKVVCYSCNSVGKNVLLKYVGNGEIKFRNGVIHFV